MCRGRGAGLPAPCPALQQCCDAGDGAGATTHVHERPDDGPDHVAEKPIAFNLVRSEAPAFPVSGRCRSSEASRISDR